MPILLPITFYFCFFQSHQKAFQAFVFDLLIISLEIGRGTFLVRESPISNTQMVW